MRGDRVVPTLGGVDVRLRGLTRADVAAWNRLLADIERADHTGEHYNEADLLEEMANPDIEPGKDMVGAFDGEELIGFFTVYPRASAEETHKIHLEGAVHPRRRGEGVGTLLAEAMIARAEQAHAEQCPGVPPLYVLGGLPDDPAQDDLLDRIGLRPEQWSFTMRAQLGDCPEPGPLPDGLRIRRYDEEVAALLRDTHNTVFMDHPNFTPWTEVMWRQWVTESRSFRPRLSFVVLDVDVPGQLAAYVQTSEYDAYFQATGRREAYVGKVGTRREYRGRGVATVLLQHCLRAYQEAGYDEASLDVDSENPTGALGVYQRAGFMVERKRTEYFRRR